MNKIDIKEFELLKVKLLKAKNIAKNNSEKADVVLSKNKENAALKKESVNAKTTLNTLSLAISLNNRVISLMSETKVTDKKIKVLSNRRLKINGVLLAYKEIAEIQNTNEAKRCLKSGLIALV